ncbi:MAG: TMEM175 family protein [Nostocales cyanobacterium 94392]|nr:TMEM175 family protein [Nostocales cyanobacterium 94392]
MNNNNNSNSINMISHLGRLSDTIFALAMALTIFGFDFPEFTRSINNSDMNKFLIAQLEPLENYLITFAILAFYWIDHVKQFSYYRKTNEVHLWLYLIYLMCLFLVPYSNALIMLSSENVMVQVLYSVNIFFIGLFSFLNWSYASYKHRLIDVSLDNSIINYMKVTSLIEPIVALITIIVSLINPSWWDISWLSVVIFYVVVEIFFKKLVGMKIMDFKNRRDAENAEEEMKRDN